MLKLRREKVFVEQGEREREREEEEEEETFSCLFSFESFARIHQAVVTFAPCEFVFLLRGSAL